MHKLDLPTKPNNYDSVINWLVQEYPPASCASENVRWAAFRDSALYSAVCEVLEKNQRGICAYCEIPLNERNKQIEHFIPKKTTTVDDDFTYNFFNMLLCCVGGTNPYSIKGGEFSNNPTAKVNHSCGETKGDINPLNKCLNPYELPDFPLFTYELDIEGIKLAPDVQACEKANVKVDMVESTLKMFNLNCPRLVRRRGQIWQQLDEDVIALKKLAKEEQKEALLVLEQAYLHDDPAFYTTKKLYLVDYLN